MRDSGTGSRPFSIGDKTEIMVYNLNGEIHEIL